MEQLKTNIIDEIDDALWSFIQLAARKTGIKNLSNDEFNNEMIADVRNRILDHLEPIKEDREKY